MLEENPLNLTVETEVSEEEPPNLTVEMEVSEKEPPNLTVETEVFGGRAAWFNWGDGGF